MVTRFSSRCGNSAEPGFELVLLRELEIAKILINSYYNDLRDAKASLISRSDVNELVKQIRQSVPAGERSSSISVYDVVSLRSFSFSLLGNIKESSDIVFGVFNSDGCNSYEVALSNSELSFKIGVLEIDKDFVKYLFFIASPFEDNIFSFVKLLLIFFLLFILLF